MPMQIRLTGDTGEISVVAFKDIISRMVSLLNELDTSSTRDDIKRDWLISSLSNGSACVAVSAAHEEGKPALPRTLATIRELQEKPEIPRGANETALGTVIKLYKMTGKRGVTGIELSEFGNKDSRVYAIDSRVAENARRAISVRSGARSSFRGRLDKINIRGKTPEFSLFDEHSNVSLRCRLAEDSPSELYEQVKKLVGSHVSARGDLKRNLAGQPIHMRVDRVRVLNEINKPTSVRDIQGIAPDWTSGMSSVDFVRMQRNANSDRGRVGE